jgi:hypothetical protein
MALNARLTKPSARADDHNAPRVTQYAHRALEHASARAGWRVTYSDQRNGGR